jgi:uncharacterized protein
MSFILFLLALAGHGFLWVGLANRLHAVGARRWIIKGLTLLAFGCMSSITLAGVWWYATIEWSAADMANHWFGSLIHCENGDDGLSTSGLLPWICAAYVVLCWVVAPVTVVRLVWMRLHQRRPSVVRYFGRRYAEINVPAAAASAHELFHHPLTRLPRNEVLRIEVMQWTLDVPRLPPALDGLSIVHFSDLHFTGLVSKAFFREAVRVCNELQPDLMCISGDIVDREACVDWIPDILGRLTARHGVYYVLGNHDRRVNVDRLRRTLTQSGLIVLGGRWLAVEINDTPVLMAGDERPWFPESPGIAVLGDRVAADGCGNAARAKDRPLRIVLAHTPDRLAWAREQEADLMLAGHTHGGQIRIPPLGAILSPSSEGVRHICGIYYRPPTILHVSRGLSGDIPLRWNCPPEIALLKLRSLERSPLASPSVSEQPA